MRKYALLLSTALLLVGSLSGQVASAQTSTQKSGSNPITCGLWAGSSLDVNNLAKCKPNSAAASTTTNTYVALGDSVAAGLGLPMSGNATAQDVQCGRSSFAYPTYVASATRLPLLNLACSGATAGDLVTQQHTSGPNPSAQLDTAFANGIPRLITITAGANDAHWADFIRACYAYDCTGSAYQLAAQAYLASLRVKLSYALQDIQYRSSNRPPPVIITGYYNPLSPSCANQQQQITGAEIAWLTRETSSLNNALQSTAKQYTFATFVPISFSGHELCSTQASWVQGLSDPAPFHPTAQGQQAIANTILGLF